MKKLATILTAFCCCVLFMGAAWPYAPVYAALSVNGDRAGSGGGIAGGSIAIGLALLVIIILRSWRISGRTRKKYAESERKAYSYKPRGERIDRTDRIDRVRRVSLEDMDFPSGFGGINDMEQLERNREMYRLYSELTENEDGWDDARR